MSTDNDRRTFLKRGALSAAALVVLADCTPGSDDEKPVTTGLDDALLGALGEVALPSELGADGRARVVAGFKTWLAGYEPVPELMHGYGSQEIRYGPGDPGPRWASQLAALDLEARKRWSTGFAETPLARRADLVRRHLAQAGSARLGSPVRMEHVAAALVSYWAATPDAVNRCYRRDISPETCRPLDASGDEPRPWTGEA